MLLTFFLNGTAATAADENIENRVVPKVSPGTPIYTYVINIRVKERVVFGVDSGLNVFCSCSQRMPAHIRVKKGLFSRRFVCLEYSCIFYKLFKNSH